MAAPLASLWPLPLDAPSIDINAIIIAFVILISILSAVVQFIQNMVRRARERFRDLQDGRQPMQRPGQATMRRQAGAGRAAPPESTLQQPASKAREVMSDLETILREQLGLDLSPLGPKKTQDAEGAAPSPAAAPPAPARPARPVRAAAPPRREARPAPAPVPAPVLAAPSAYDLEARHMSQDAPPPAASVVMGITRGETHDHRSPVAGVARRPEVRRLLSGPSRRSAILLQVVLGPPRADRDWQ